jgi:uncharacterized damage-inducible protein DinB/uncharacterized protein YciI
VPTYICFLTPARDTFPADASPAELATVDAHFAYLERLLAAGTLVLAGRTDEPPLTGLVVFEAADRAAAEQIAAQDPAVAGGVFRARVCPYRLALLGGPQRSGSPAAAVDSGAHLAVLRELLHYGDWARERVFAAAEPLDAAALDHPFDMGPGTLRKVLQHYYRAERFWYERWRGPSRFPASDDVPAPRELHRHLRELAVERAAWLETLTPEQLTATHAYPNDAGGTDRLTLRGMLLHVCNHGTHHRAQAVNMLRRLGAVTPELDLDTMLLERGLAAVK